MNKHCGVLDPQPSPILHRIKTQQWIKLSDELRHDLDVSLLTPGFTVEWWARLLAHSPTTILKYRRQISPDLRPEAVENWNSITRDDAIKLSQFSGDKPIPVLINIVSDKRHHLTAREICKLYKCSGIVIDEALKKPLLSHRTLPPWFRGLIPGA